MRSGRTRGAPISVCSVVYVLMTVSDCPAQTDWSTLAEKLSNIVGTGYVLLNDEAKRPYECDGLPFYTEMPGLVVLPGSTQEVQDVVKACNAYGICIVARGAGTGLSGGALPRRDGVLLSLARLCAILEIDPPSPTGARATRCA